MLDYESDADEIAPSLEQMKPLSNLVTHMRNVQKTVAMLTDELSTAQKELRKIEELDIPAMLDELGLASLTMADGAQLEVTTTLYASISAKNKPKAAAWLVDNGQGALVKEDVVVPFEKGALDEVEALSAILKDYGYKFKVTETVNTASVKALIKELLADGVEVPLDIFGAHFKRRAILK